MKIHSKQGINLNIKIVSMEDIYFERPDSFINKAITILVA